MRANVDQWCWGTDSRVVRDDVDDDVDVAVRCNFLTPRQDSSPTALASSLLLTPSERDRHHSHKHAVIAYGEQRTIFINFKKLIYLSKHQWH